MNELNLLMNGQGRLLTSGGRENWKRLFYRDRELNGRGVICDAHFDIGYFAVAEA